ncbi:hypothetical protein GS4_40_00080 [Gordonia soli NBRC 108243]|uniref:Uncharacterized protein n=1 Tax=Gordonia soli NBRC 108243 TaxID=1223545 RepID=M0QQ90_9ACTN|nr:hypothetical protein GS4_40_00080 [Gordonia soli NBRC 108243]
MWPELPRADASAKCYHVSPPMRGFSFVIGVEWRSGLVDILGSSERGVLLRGEANDELMWIHIGSVFTPSTVEAEFEKLGYTVCH